MRFVIIIITILLLSSSATRAQGPTWSGVVRWFQDESDVSSKPTNWRLRVDRTTQPTWPRAQCTPEATPGVYSHDATVPQGSSIDLVACNTAGCSSPSNTKVIQADTPTAMPPPTPTPSKSRPSAPVLL